MLDWFFIYIIQLACYCWLFCTCCTYLHRDDLEITLRFSSFCVCIQWIVLSAWVISKFMEFAHQWSGSRVLHTVLTCNCSYSLHFMYLFAHTSRNPTMVFKILCAYNKLFSLLESSPNLWSCTPMMWSTLLYAILTCSWLISFISCSFWFSALTALAHSSSWNPNMVSKILCVHITNCPLCLSPLQICGVALQWSGSTVLPIVLKCSCSYSLHFSAYLHIILLEIPLWFSRFCVHTTNCPFCLNPLQFFWSCTPMEWSTLLYAILKCGCSYTSSISCSSWFSALSALAHSSWNPLYCF